MGISSRVSDWLNATGHNAIHLSEEGLHSLEDIHIIEKAIKENRIILTADLDFGHLLATHKNYAVSVIQFRVTNFKATNIIGKLNLIFARFSDSFDSHHLTTIEDERVRLRKLPIK
jgi:predicted nuclease of predicted toxin-antitoxin system